MSYRTLQDIAAFALLLLAIALIANAVIGCSSVKIDPAEIATTVQRQTSISLTAFTVPDSICAAVLVQHNPTGLQWGYGPQCFALADIFGRAVIIAPLDAFDTARGK